MTSSSRSTNYPIVIPIVGARSVGSLTTLIRAGGATKTAVRLPHATHRKVLAKAVAPHAYTKRQRASLLARADLNLDRVALSGEFSLSVRKPYVSGSGELYFFNVSDYIPTQDRAALFMTKLGGGSFFSVIVHADAPGARYLLDISVSGAPGLRLDSAFGGASATADSKGHVLMVVTAGSNSDAAISLVVNGSGMYNLHNVVVSRI